MHCTMFDASGRKTAMTISRSATAQEHRSGFVSQAGGLLGGL